MIYRVLKRAEIWKHVERYSRAADVRKAAIAYVTKDFIGLRRGDVLIADASDEMIKAGQTSAKLLRVLFKRGVFIYNRPGLHAKTVLLGDYCIIGSANMSGGKREELAVFTNNQTVISGVAAFISNLEKGEIDEREINRLVKIPVSRRRFGSSKGESGKRTPRLGGRTWIVGTYPLTRDPSPEDQRAIERDRSQLNKDERTRDFDWEYIQWGKKSDFFRRCSVGDTIIQIWSNKGSARAYVTRGVPLLRKGKGRKLAWTFVGDRPREADTVSWGRFQRILKAAGGKPVKRYSVRELDDEVAEAIGNGWTKIR